MARCLHKLTIARVALVLACSDDSTVPDAGNPASRALLDCQRLKTTFTP